MITPNDIVTHLQTYLPVFTDLFGDKLTASATVSSSTVTVTSAAHGLTVGQSIIVSGGQFSNSIASVTDNGDGTLRFTTDYDHDLTEPKAVNDYTTLTLAGLAPPWNGEHTIVAIPNRRTFEISYPSGEDTPPSIASANLIENRAAGLISTYQIATVPDANTFTFEVSGIPSLPTGAIVNIQVQSGAYIFGAESADRAEAIYAQYAQGLARPMLFVIMSDADVSKDRHTLNDSVSSVTGQNLGKQIIMQNFSTLVIYPTGDETSGFNAQNLFYGDVYRALASTLFGFFFNDPDTSTKYRCVNDGHGPGDLRQAYAIHVYDWQVPSVVSFENGFLLQPDVAFRDIVSDWFNNSDDEALMELGVNIDDEPL